MFIKGATLLSVKEAKTLLTQKEREYERWWWLRSPGSYQDYAATVYNDGSVHYYGLGVDYDSGCVRPALKINIENSDFKIGDIFVFDYQKFKIVSDSLAFCLSDIGPYYFRKDWEAEDADDYEASDVKKFVDAWFEVAMSDYEYKEREDEYQERTYEHDYLQMASKIDGRL